MSLNSIGFGIASAFALKAIFTVSNFALLTLAARSLGLETFGVYSLLFSAAGLLGVVATFGQQVLVMRFWNEYHDAEQAGLLKGALRFSAVVCLSGSVVIAVPFYLWCAAAYSTEIAGAVTFYLVAMSLIFTTSHLVRTAVSVEAGDGFGILLLTLPAAIYLAGCMVAGTAAGLPTLFSIMGAGGVVGTLVHLALMHRAIKRRFPEFRNSAALYSIRPWMNRSSKLWLSNGLEAASQHLDVLVIGYLMHPTVAGAYFVITRVANLPAVAIDAIYMFSTRHVPDLYYRKRFTRLGELLDTVAWVALAVLAGLVLAIGFGGGHLLSIFNPSYAQYHGVLIILSVGTASVAAAGPSPSILMLTGHEGRWLAIIGGTVLARVAGFFLLVPLFGIAGGASATALAFIAMALMLRQSVRGLTGFDASVLRLTAPIGGRDRVRMAE